MPTEEVAAPSESMGDSVAVATPPATAAAAAPAGKKRRAASRMGTGATQKAASKGTKVQHSHPPYGSMIKAAILANPDKKGSSRAAILKYIMQNYEVGENATLVNSRLRMGLKRGVASGALKQMKGTGASGSFRLADAKPEPAKSVKKPVVKKTVAAGDMKAPSPKKSTKAKSIKKGTASKTVKTKAPPRKKVAASEWTASKKTKKAGSSPKGKGKGSSAAKPKMAKSPSHARSKKVAA